jgi:hypothetical protein
MVDAASALILRQKLPVDLPEGRARASVAEQNSPKFV